MIRRSTLLRTTAAMVARWISLGLGLGIGTASPATAGPLTDAWRAATTYDAEFLAAIETRAADAEAGAKARALFRPKVQAQLAANVSGGTVDVTVPPEYASLVTNDFKGSSTSASLEIRQPIYDSKSAAQALQLREKARAAQTTFSVQQQNLILRVAEVMFGVLTAEGELALTRSQKAAIGIEKRQAQARFDRGAAKITDVREADAQFDQLTAAEIAALAERAVALAKYHAVIGSPPVPGLTLRPQLEPGLPEGSLLDWQDAAERSGPAVVAAAHSLNSARAAVNQYRWRGRPTVAAVGTYSGTWLGGGDGQFPFPRGVTNYAAGIQATVPLMSGGLYSAELRAALASVRKAERDLEGERRTARIAAEQAWLGVTSGAARIRALRAAAESATLQLRAATTGREVGVRTQSDVLQAQAQVFSTRQNLLRANSAYESSRLRLAASAGKLDDGVLARIDEDF